MSEATNHSYIRSCGDSLAQSFNDRPLIQIGLAIWLAALLLTGLLVYVGPGMAESITPII